MREDDFSDYPPGKLPSRDLVIASTAIALLVALIAAIGW